MTSVGENMDTSHCFEDAMDKDGKHGYHEIDRHMLRLDTTCDSAGDKILMRRHPGVN